MPPRCATVVPPDGGRSGPAKPGPGVPIAVTTPVPTTGTMTGPRGYLGGRGPGRPSPFDTVTVDLPLPLGLPRITWWSAVVFWKRWKRGALLRTGVPARDPALRAMPRRRPSDML